MVAQDKIITTSAGRLLGIQYFGDRTHQAILILNGTPTSRLINPDLFEYAEASNLFLICYERPGYGDSTWHQGRTLKDAADDVEEILEALGLQKVSIIGISGGGPHALAIAHERPDLIQAGAILCSPAPFSLLDCDGFDYYEGMTQRKINRLKLFFNSREGFMKYLESSRAEILAADDVYLKNRLTEITKDETMTIDFYKYSYETMERTSSRNRRLLSGL